MKGILKPKFFQSFSYSHTSIIGRTVPVGSKYFLCSLSSAIETSLLNSLDMLTIFCNEACSRQAPHITRELARSYLPPKESHCSVLSIISTFKIIISPDSRATVDNRYYPSLKQLFKFIIINVTESFKLGSNA